MAGREFEICTGYGACQCSHGAYHHYRWHHFSDCFQLLNGDGCTYPHFGRAVSRLLPQLVAQKFHQVVLGIYMGTIIYSLILVISIGPENNLPALGILISMLLAILSLALFIYFIHSISRSIQVDNIMRGILKRGCQQLEELLDHHKSTKTLHSAVPEHSVAVKARETGYYFYSSPELILNFLKKKGTQLQDLHLPGTVRTSG